MKLLEVKQKILIKIWAYKMIKKLILFDIDGTLIDAGKAGTCSINKAFHKLFLIENAFENITLAGKTDMQVIKEALAFYELSPKDDMISALLSSYLKNLKKEANTERGHVKPGVKELLENLSKINCCVLGLFKALNMHQMMHTFYAGEKRIISK